MADGLTEAEQGTPLESEAPAVATLVPLPDIIPGDLPDGTVPIEAMESIHWTPPRPRWRWHPFSPGGYIGTVRVAQGYRLIEFGFLFALILTAGSNALQAAIVSWGPSAAPTDVAGLVGLLLNRVGLALALIGLDLCGYLDTLAIILGFLLVTLAAAQAPRRPRTLLLSVAALALFLVIVAADQIGAYAVLGGGLAGALVRAVLVATPFLLVASAYSTRLEQSLVTTYAATLLLAQFVGSLLPLPALQVVLAKFLVVWVALAAGAIGFHLLANRLSAFDPAPPLKQRLLPIEVPTTHSARIGLRALRHSRGHQAAALTVALLVLVSLPSIAAVGDSLVDRPTHRLAGGMVLTPIEVTTVTGSVSEGETIEIPVEVTQSMVVALNLTLLFADEPDQSRHTNQPDSFSVEAAVPGGPIASGAATNPHNGEGSIALTLYDGDQVDLDAVPVSINVTLSDAGDQTPSIGPNVLGLRTNADRSNDFSLTLYVVAFQPADG